MIYVFELAILTVTTIALSIIFANNHYIHRRNKGSTTLFPRSFVNVVSLKTYTAPILHFSLFIKYKF